MDLRSSHAKPMKTATRTLLALTAAAAFGGFAATGMQLMLQRPAAAEPARFALAVMVSG